VWSTFLCAQDLVKPVGNVKWRASNKSYNSESLQLLDSLIEKRKEIAVVYADPPYTQDHYSRYYHLLDTLVLYDYPRVTAKARYRPDRLASAFGLRSRVANALDRLVRSSYELGSDIILSYPVGGLASKVGIDIVDVVKRHYCKLDVVRAVAHQHSTMGASKGNVRSNVSEQIIMARI